MAKEFSSAAEAGTQPLSTLSGKDAGHAGEASGSLRALLSFLRELWWFLGEYRFRLLAMFLLIMVCSTTTLIPPWVLGQVLEMLNDPDAEFRIGTYSALMGALLLLLHWLRVHLKKRTADYRAAISASARQQAIDLLLAQGLREGRLVGNEVSRLDTGLRDFAELHRIFQNEILFGLISFVGCSLVFASQAPALFLSTVVYIVCFFAVLRWSIPKVREAQTSVSLARESFSGIFTNVVGNALSVRASGAEESMGRRVGSSVQSLESSERERNRITSRQWGALNTINTVYLSIALAQTGFMGIRGALPVSLVVVSYSYVRELIRSVVGVMDVAEEFIQNYVGFRRLLHLLSTSDDVFSRTRPAPNAWKTITIHGVTHRYPGSEHQVLQDITWDIHAGTCIGLRGRSGAGKSTLLKILLGLVPPAGGKVLLDGEELTTFTPQSLRNLMAIALQECEILGLSLRENITLCREVDDEWMEQVIAATGLQPLIEKLPSGLDTLVGERGYRLSGGERQRVALARAIVRKPSLLVIDEATSMLDSESEHRFFEALGNLLPGLTTIIISHHDRRWSIADEIYFLEAGRLVRRSEATTTSKAFSAEVT